MSASEKASESYLLKDPIRFESESKRLRLQAGLLFNLEKKSLAEHGVLKARRLMELGCGNGAFLTALHAAVPGILTFGLDRNQALLDQAKMSLPDSTFICEDLAGGESLENAVKKIRPNSIVVRFVMQHLSPREQNSMLSAIRKSKEPDVRVVLMDTDDSKFEVSPDCPAIRALLKMKCEKQSLQGGNRMIGSELEAKLNQHGFEECILTEIKFDNSNIGLKTWFDVFWPVLTAACSDDAGTEQGAQIKEALEWFQEGYTNPDYLIGFHIRHVSGI